MPKKGKFSLELIDAATEEAFKEFPGSNGVDAYVEVEPHLEYFVQVKSDYPTKYVSLNIEVDGKTLGYTSKGIKRGGVKKRGLWSYDEMTAQSVMTALRFHKAVSQSAIVPSEANTDNKSDVGTVKVSFFECIKLEGSHERQDGMTKFAGTSQVKDNQHHDSKKYLISQPGKKRKLKHMSGPKRNYINGRKLETIKVRYCSTVGLIENGVIPKPPLWEWNKMVKPNLANSLPQELKIEPTLIKHEICDSNGNIMTSVEKDYFDLTNLEDEGSLNDVIKSTEIQIHPTSLKHETCDNNGNIVKSIEKDLFDLTRMKGEESYVDPVEVTTKIVVGSPKRLK